jgi:hypothetical protein
VPGNDYLTYEPSVGWSLVMDNQPVFNVTRSGIKIGQTKILGPRVTGFVAGKGTPSFGPFDASSATLSQVSARLLALEFALRKHGLID